MQTDEFDGFKLSRKHSIFVIDSYLKDSAFSAVKGKQSSIQGMRIRKGVLFVNRRMAYMHKRDTFFVKNGI